MNLHAWMSEYQPLIENTLLKYVSASFPSETLQKAMAYSLMAGGKRIRPLLGIATAQALGQNPQTMLPAACALEMIHSYSLIHDDLPAMDNDDLRRGKPTNHKVFGEAGAILAGDGLLTLAFETLADPEWALDAEKKIQVIAIIAQGAGARGMVAGQLLDMESENQTISPAQLQTIHENKTGALLCAAVTSAAHCYDCSAEDHQALKSFGTHIGLAFQIADDILDVTQTTQALGKTAGSDTENGKATYPAIFGLETSIQKAKDCMDQATQSLQRFGDLAQPLKNLASYIIERKA
ncbi:MAG: polyprenyl synthetase family protein [Bdellovibrionota bacterium]